MSKKCLIFAAFFAAVCASGPACAADAARSPGAGDYIPAKVFSLGVNYPGASLRYFTSRGRALELFGQSQGRIFDGGLRYYYYPESLARGAFCPYWTVEGNYTGFKGKYSKGSGVGLGAFGGVEYFLGRRLSLQSDAGLLYLSIHDKSTSLGESGPEFVMNIGFNFYFLGAAK